MFSLKFWQAAFERAVKTFAQTLAALLTANATSILALDWGEVLSVAGLATLASFLTSIGSTKIGEGGAPAAFGPETVEPAPTARHAGMPADEPVE